MNIKQQIKLKEERKELNNIEFSRERTAEPKLTRQNQLFERRVRAQRLRNRFDSSITNSLPCEMTGRQQTQNTENHSLGLIERN